MKKNYEQLQINVISLDNADVIATSLAERNNSLLDAIFNFGDDLKTQIFNS